MVNEKRGKQKDLIIDTDYLYGEEDIYYYTDKIVVVGKKYEVEINIPNGKIYLTTAFRKNEVTRYIVNKKISHCDHDYYDYVAVFTKKHKYLKNKRASRNECKNCKYYSVVEEREVCTHSHATITIVRKMSFFRKKVKTAFRDISTNRYHLGSKESGGDICGAEAKYFEQK